MELRRLRNKGAKSVPCLWLCSGCALRERMEKKKVSTHESDFGFGKRLSLSLLSSAHRVRDAEYEMGMLDRVPGARG